MHDSNICCKARLKNERKRKKLKYVANCTDGLIIMQLNDTLITVPKLVSELENIGGLK